ncbi:hypothetical protein C4K18_1615 [Pseudomonas chlororaphis subsp. aurantiaca]|nr:hypothetical protein C4K18_1615 [Pseudomonas chlororaphis subsp. aurantiaca]
MAAVSTPLSRAGLMGPSAAATGLPRASLANTRAKLAPLSPGSATLAWGVAEAA